MLQNNAIPTAANYIQQGTGSPVILIHGLAASLHDWDELLPELTASGYACYALDLLGHGDSPKPDERVYQMDWIFEHFFHWVESLHLTQPAIMIGHSLGGHLALEYARRVPAATRSLILVNPFYTASQLPLLMRKAYRRATLNGLVTHRLPEWLLRFFVDVSSVAMGYSVGARHSLPEKVRAQTALDFKRTASGVYHIPNVIYDLTPHLPEIHAPALVVWGEHDQTLTPASFLHLVEELPNARGEVLRAGHVPHQSHAEVFNRIVMKFLRENK